MIHKYYLKLQSLEALEAVLLETLGTTSSTKDFTVVPVSEPQEIIGGMDEEPLYSEASNFVYANVYSPESIEWPEGVESETPATPWSDLS